ncbi:MAG TPA: serine/threonine-protein kinase [Steroidobacteraceae bacterium]|jgi:serine/threonine protein kinase|nr:serine/threonine-protein kinase [Steroidobacteraceae bacterium]
MSDEIESRWQRLSEFLDEALELTDPVERARWLASLEQQDADMAAQVARMLAAQSRQGYAEFLATPLATPDPLPAIGSLAGRTVGPYVLEAEIGRGGMGSVWRARRADGRVSGLVAIKLLHAAWLGRDGEARFRQEGNLLARLDHLNIARLIDAGILDDIYPYLVIEYVDGLPIDEYCERENLGIEARLQLFQATLAAVGHAHSHLIVHRDIKPSNVFVTSGGVIKLLDFGIAKLLDDADDGAALTKTGLRALTPEYAAPEQLLGQAVTTQTDIYALGLVLYLLLTGRNATPQDAQGTAHLVRAIIDEDAARASTAVEDLGRRRALTGDLDNILAKALKKAPEERYSNASAFSDDLRRFLSHEPVTAGPDTVRYRVSKFVRRHRGAVATTALTGMALLLAIVITTTQWFEARHQRDIARVQLQRAAAFGDLVSIVLNESGHAGEALTTGQLLERGEKLVRSEFASSDDLRSQLLFTLARLYAHVGATDKQRVLYRESYELATRSGDVGLIALSGCAAAAADAASGLGKDAAQRIDQLLARLPRDAENDEVRAGCLNFASTVADFAGDGTAALADAEQADQLLANSQSGTEWEKVDTMIFLADARRAAGQLGAADQTYARVAAEFQRIGVEDSGFAATLYNNWGILLVNLGLPVRGAQLFDRERAIDQGYSLNDAFSATAYASALVPLGRAADAREILQAALNRAIQIGNHRSAAMVQMGLARVNSELGDLDRSDRFLAELEPVLRDMLPPGHEAFGALHQIKSQNFAKRSDYIAALNEATLALGIFSAHPGLMYRAAAVHESMAGILLAMKNLPQAHAEVLQARNTFNAAFGPDAKSYYLGRTWLTEAKIDEVSGERQNARSAAEAAYQHFVASVGETHPLTEEAKALR